jgi:hypothetical protein
MAGGGGSGGWRRSEEARKLWWLTVAWKAVASLEGQGEGEGAKPFGRRSLGGGTHRGWWSAAASVAALQRFYRAPGWSCGSMRGGRQ